ncbi:hypothetical protein HK104_006143, partial [Borealophlyctis nickersoniae]
MSSGTSEGVDPQLRASEIAQSLAEVCERVRQAQRAAGSAKEVRLVAVSKTKPASDILHAYGLGQRHFGENIQELASKSEELPSDIAWHFIDSIKKADAMNKACAARDTPLRVFAQVNTSGEASKSGMLPADCVEVARHIVQNCDKLQLAGLMTIGSPEREPEETNPDFQCLCDCKARVDAELGTDLELSMGMSDDFELAIRMGSTN